MRTPATSPDAVTTGMLSAITGSCASRGSTTHARALQRAACSRPPATKRAATTAALRAWRARDRDARPGSPARGQDVAGRVGQQQAGEPRPQPLLLRQRQRAAGGERLIAARRRSGVRRRRAAPTRARRRCRRRGGRPAARGRRAPRWRRARRPGRTGRPDRARAGPAGSPPAGRAGGTAACAAAAARPGRPASAGAASGPGRPAASSARTTLSRPDSDCPAAARVISVASWPEQPSDADDQHRDAEDDPVAEAGEDRDPAAPGQERHRQHFGDGEQGDERRLRLPGGPGGGDEPGQRAPPGAGDQADEHREHPVQAQRVAVGQLDAGREQAVADQAGHQAEGQEAEERPSKRSVSGGRRGGRGRHA